MYVRTYVCLIILCYAYNSVYTYVFYTYVYNIIHHRPYVRTCVHQCNPALLFGKNIWCTHCVHMYMYTSIHTGSLSLYVKIPLKSFVVVCVVAVVIVLPHNWQVSGSGVSQRTYIQYMRRYVVLCRIRTHVNRKCAIPIVHNLMSTNFSYTIVQ